MNIIKSFDIFRNYLKGLFRVPLEKANEHTFRTDLEMMLRGISEAMHPQILVIHERASLEYTTFRPDFVVERNQEPVSCIETKPLGEDLRPILSSTQLQNYRRQYDHVILTNYLEWYWFQRGEETQHFTLCTLQDIENKVFELKETVFYTFKQFLQNFFGAEVRFITNLRDFATSLGEKAAVIRDYLFFEIYHQERRKEGRGILYQIYQSFQGNVQESVSIETFSNAFAQTIVYGLFIARMNAKDEKITLQNAQSFVSKSFRVVKELVTFFDALEYQELYDIKRMIDTILVTFNNFDSQTIFDSLSFEKWKERLNAPEIQTAMFQQDKELIELDPYIYFYEDFLQAFDPTMRKARGVYYTPPEIVNFIIRATNQILETDFQKSQGFANKQVTALDFATGTGAFLLEIFKQVFENLQYKVPETLIKEHLLQNIFGFEYLLAPYTIAHLKVSQFLREQGYELTEDERLKIFLTNTLTKVDLSNFTPDMFLPAMAQETIDSQQIKNMPVLVITGNPPYSNYQRDKDTQAHQAHILNLLKDYKDGLNEKKTNLDDDYIKFMRFAHDKIARAGHGVMAIITNNSYLDGVTHRKMREKLYETFDKIYILNLHGNSLKNEGDVNVFDIRVGVAIAIFVKISAEKPLPEAQKQVLYFSTKENNLIKRKEKQLFLKNNTLEAINWKPLKMQAPYFWFVEKNLNDMEYEEFWSITNIFKVYSVGIKTKIDAIAIDFETDKLKERVKDIIENKYTLEVLTEKYGINEKTTWEYEKVLAGTFDENRITDYDYRPFDVRKIYYDKNFLSRYRGDVMNNFFEHKNIGLEVARTEIFTAFVSDKVSDEHFATHTSYKMPLYTFETNTEGQQSRQENFSTDFRNFIHTQYGEGISTTQIAGYLYAILHHPTYRTKYAEYLKIDFPKIPFTPQKDTFLTLAQLGWELIEVHLRHKQPVSTLALKNNVAQFAKVEQIVFKDNKVFVGKGNYISGIPPEVFDFQIGTYKVLDKWLKDRKGRVLMLSDFEYYIEIIKIIDFTVIQMKLIQNTISL